MSGDLEAAVRKIWAGPSRPDSAKRELSHPGSIALQTGSRVYVVDTNNSRLQTFDSQTTAGWSCNQIGNMTLRDGVAYTYGSSKPHAVTAAGSNNYVYDNNGNMTSRAGQSLTWDVENRLTSAGGSSYVYGLPRTRYSSLPTSRALDTVHSLRCGTHAIT